MEQEAPEVIILDTDLLTEQFDLLGKKYSVQILKVCEAPLSVNVIAKKLNLHMSTAQAFTVALWKAGYLTRRKHQGKKRVEHHYLITNWAKEWLSDTQELFREATNGASGLQSEEEVKVVVRSPDSPGAEEFAGEDGEEE